MVLMRRRDLLTTTAVLLGSRIARADVIEGALPWKPDAANPPRTARPGPWLYFSDAEAAAIEALVDRLIPADGETPGGKDAGCAVFIDRQLAGPYGRFAGLYRGGPFVSGTKQQGDQSELDPARRYRQGLTALDQYCRSTYGGKGIALLPEATRDEVLGGLEKGTLALPGADGQAFFELLLKDTQQGFFADPIYGGNRDMASWKMIGFPGARYDYRDWVDRHNERYPLPPVSIMGRPDWTAKTP